MMSKKSSADRRSALFTNYVQKWSPSLQTGVAIFASYPYFFSTIRFLQQLLPPAQKLFVFSKASIR